MGGSYLAAGGVIHAKTMLAYHRDARHTAAVLVVAMGAAFGLQGWMWLDMQAAPFAFGALFALLLALGGMWLHIHHGKQVAHWEKTLEVWERVRRDRLVHARKLKGFEL